MRYPDFNERNYALAEAEPRIDWRVIPSQVDDLDGDGKGDELVWVRTLLPGEKARLWCYYTPGGAAQPDFTPRADAAMNWDTGTHGEHRLGIRPGRLPVLLRTDRGLRQESPTAINPAG